MSGYLSRGGAGNRGTRIDFDRANIRGPRPDSVLADRTIFMPNVAKSSPRFDSLAQEVYLGLWRTYDRLRSYEDELFSKFELTAQQYNVLRLLKAARPETVP